MRNSDAADEGYRLETPLGRAFAEDIETPGLPSGRALGIAAGAVSGAIVGVLLTLVAVWLLG